MSEFWKGILKTRARAEKRLNESGLGSLDPYVMRKRRECYELGRQDQRESEMRLRYADTTT